MAIYVNMHALWASMAHAARSCVTAEGTRTVSPPLDAASVHRGSMAHAVGECVSRDGLGRTAPRPVTAREIPHVTLGMADVCALRAEWAPAVTAAVGRLITGPTALRAVSVPMVASAISEMAAAPAYRDGSA